MLSLILGIADFTLTHYFKKQKGNAGQGGQGGTVVFYAGGSINNEGKINVDGGKGGDVL